MQLSARGFHDAGERQGPGAEPLKVWLIDEGHAGHRAQSEGILHALQRLGLRLDVTAIRCEMKLRGFLRPLAKAVFHRMSGPQALRFASRIARFQVPADGPPAFIISSGGQSAFVSRALSLHTGAPNIFVGNLGHFPPGWFAAVMSPVDFGAPQCIVTSAVPNAITPDKCREEALRYWDGRVPRGRWALLVGGANRNHPYGESDWAEIAGALNGLARKFGIKWLITTSRRSGADVERLLAREVDPDAVEEMVLFSSHPKKVVQPFLGTAEIVFVTQDSLTMLAEAIASGRPVVAIQTGKTRPRAGTYGSEVLDKYYRLPQVSAMRSFELTDYSPPTDLDKTYPQQAEAIMLAAKQLVSRLKIGLPEEKA
jgi:hypothetical protein